MYARMKQCYRVLRKKIVLIAVINLVLIGVFYYLPPFQAGDYDFQVNYDPTVWVLNFRLINITLFTTPSTQDVNVRLIIPGVLNETIASFDYIPGLLFYEPNASFEKTLEGLPPGFSPNIDLRLDLGVPGYYPAIPTYAYHRRDGVWELRFQSPGYLDAYAEFVLLLKDPAVSLTNNGGFNGVVSLVGKSFNQTSVMEVEVLPHETSTSVMKGVFTSIESSVKLCLINRFSCFTYAEDAMYFALRDNMIFVILPLLLVDVIYLQRACRRISERAGRGTKKI